MKRLLILAALAVAWQASPASAQFIKLSGTPGTGLGSGNQPPPLGPWYNYWPLEAHFQVPAMPEYPYFSAPQTLPITRPGGMYGNGPGGHGVHPGGQAMLSNPGLVPNAPPAAYAGANPYAGFNNPYLAAQRPQAPVGQPQQAQQPPNPAQLGAMYYPNPYQGYYPNAGYPAAGYYPNAARR
jgi:hypothetical protein